MYLSLIPAILNTVAAIVSDFYAQLILAGFYMTVIQEFKLFELSSQLIKSSVTTQGFYEMPIPQLFYRFYTIIFVARHCLAFL